MGVFAERPVGTLLVAHNAAVDEQRTRPMVEYVVRGLVPLAKSRRGWAYGRAEQQTGCSRGSRRSKTRLRPPRRTSTEAKRAGQPSRGSSTLSDPSRAATTLTG